MFIIILKIIGTIALMRLVGAVITVLYNSLVKAIEMKRYDNNPERKRKIKEMRERIEKNLKNT